MDERPIPGDLLKGPLYHPYTGNRAEAFSAGFRNPATRSADPDPPGQFHPRGARSQPGNFGSGWSMG